MSFSPLVLTACLLAWLPFEELSHVAVIHHAVHAGRVGRTDEASAWFSFPFSTLNHPPPDQWYEEDTPTQIHPKDPFKRIDTLHCARPLSITVPDPSDPQATSTITLAHTPFSVVLHETLLPARYYVPLTSIPAALLRRSETRSLCPYKGEAEYYDVVLSDASLGRNGAAAGGGVNGHGHGHAGAAAAAGAKEVFAGTRDERYAAGEVVLKDLVWYYATPKPEVAAVAGMCCFYNEKVDVWLDGVRLERPRSFWS